MTFMFDAVVAKRYGTDEAIFIHAMYWWLSLNKANDKHHYDGRYWTYNSMDAMTELFPFWSVKQIRRIIKSLTDKGVLLVGNYNRVQFDRTQWYSLSDELMTYYETGRFSDVEVSAPSESAETDSVPSAQMGTRDAQTGTFDLPKWADEICPNGQMRSAQMGRPIPVNNTVNNTVSNKGNQKEDDLDDFPPDVKEAILRYFKYRSERKRTYTPTSRKQFLDDTRKTVAECGAQAVIDCINLSIANNWQGVFYERCKRTQPKPPPKGNFGERPLSSTEMESIQLAREQILREKNKGGTS